MAATASAVSVPSRPGLKFDVVAGVTTAAVVIPSAMAYATLAGLPVQFGLYTALAALPLYALLGTSPVLSVSVTSTIAVLTAGGIAAVAPADSRTTAATLALLTGLILLCAGVLRLGFVTNFISTPVLVGFKAGMGLYIASSQLGKLFGISVSRGAFLHNVGQALRHLGSAERTTLALSAVTIGVLIALARVAPRIPGALMAVVVGIGGQILLDLHARGVALVDHIPSGLPSLVLPSFSQTAPLLPAALGIALMSAIESNSAARVFSRSDASQLRTNREWAALGVANVGVALARGFPAGGGTSQTAVNARAGARSRVAGVVTALVVVLALTSLAGLFSKMPQATLGAIVLMAAVGLVKPREFRHITVIRRRDGALAVVAFASVLLLGPLKGILAAVVLSMLTLLHEANHPRISVLRRQRDLIVLRPEGNVYFANADQVHDKILELVESGEADVVVLDGSSIPDLEYTGLEMLARLHQELARRNVELRLASLNRRPRAMIEARKLDARLFETVDNAVAAYAPGEQ